MTTPNRDIDDAVHTIIHCWSDWKEFAEGEAQSSQDTDAYLLALESQVRAVIEGFAEEVARPYNRTISELDLQRLFQDRTLEGISAHTPGPWDVRIGKPFDHEKSLIVCIGEGTFESICEHIASVGYVDSEENQANAARIVSCVNGCEGINPAAVKDLLEACVAIVHYDESGGREPFREAADAAREAIAKAKSE